MHQIRGMGQDQAHKLAPYARSIPRGWACTSTTYSTCTASSLMHSMQHMPLWYEMRGASPGHMPHTACGANLGHTLHIALACGEYCMWHPHRLCAGSSMDICLQTQSKPAQDPACRAGLVRTPHAAHSPDWPHAVCSSSQTSSAHSMQCLGQEPVHAACGRHCCGTNGTAPQAMCLTPLRYIYEGRKAASWILATLT